MPIIYLTNDNSISLKNSNTLFSEPEDEDEDDSDSDKEEEKEHYSKNECKKRFNTYGKYDCSCIDHDMICSDPSGNFVIAESGNFKYWGICVGSFKTNVLECCVEHDIDLWCSTNFIYGFYYAEKFYQCIISKVINNYSNKVGIFCEKFTPLMWIHLQTLVQNALLYLLSRVALTSWWDPKFTNYDGENSKSCLCGGSRPTFCCAASLKKYEKGRIPKNVPLCMDSCCQPKNLCSRPGLNNKAGEGCFTIGKNRKKRKVPCYKTCKVSSENINYKEEKLAFETRLIPVESSYYSKENGSLVNENLCCKNRTQKNCTESCFNCYYTCKRSKKTGDFSWDNGKFEVHARDRGIDCCNGTPNPDISNKKNICPTYLNDNNHKGIPPCNFNLIKMGVPCIDPQKNESDAIDINKALGRI